jgi:hypothetical protein
VILELEVTLVLEPEAGTGAGLQVEFAERHWHSSWQVVHASLSGLDGVEEGLKLRRREPVWEESISTVGH